MKPVPGARSRQRDLRTQIQPQPPGVHGIDDGRSAIRGRIEHPPLGRRVGRSQLERERARSPHAELATGDRGGPLAEVERSAIARVIPAEESDAEPLLSPSERRVDALFLTGHSRGEKCGCDQQQREQAEETVAARRAIQAV